MGQQRRQIGRISGLTRYPVKSMAGEQLDRIEIAPYGLYGDRSHALIDETKEGWDRYITARQIPTLLGYRAKFRDGGQEAGGIAGGEFPSLQITSPDGRQLHWDEQLAEEIRGQARGPVALLRLRPDSGELMAVDTGGILIVTDRSLRRLEQLMGRFIDARRFRPNMIISLSGDSVEDETHWIGRRLHAGDGTVLEIVEPCERCIVVTMDPDTYERDKDVLIAVKETMNLKFGVYASVIRTGTAAVGDTVEIEE